MQRLRLFRKDKRTRDRFAEVKLSVKDLIYPYFVVEGENIKREIKSLKNVYHFSIDEMLKDIREAVKLGLNKVLLFSVVSNSKKDEAGSYAYSEGNIVSQAVRLTKEKYPNIIVISDVCLCNYTSHGHCGIVSKNRILNDETLPLLAKTALTHAESGVDFVAPSAMMDGQVGYIRKFLNRHGFRKVKILSYSAKYASSLYGPFREAVNSAPSFGDRKTYQLDYRNISQAIEEARADIKEGADWIMVKPAHTYLDIIGRIKKEFPKKILTAYQVSGEYMMIKNMSNDISSEKTVFLEVLTSIKRAGADLIITYYAKEMARVLKNNHGNKSINQKF